MKKHTEGPWISDSSNIRTCVNSVKNNKHIAMVNICKYKEYEIDIEEHNANVALISSAPDLLNALELIIENGLNDESIDIAMNTILKAKGVNL